MPPEEIYQPRVMPQAAAPMPLARPEDYGAGVAEAVGQAVETVHDTQIRAYQIKRRLTADREAADAAHRFALQRQNLDDVIRETRSNPSSPDFADHVQRVQQAVDAARANVLDGITEDSVRRQFEQQLDAYSTQVHGAEGDFVESQRVAKTVLDRKRANDVSQNRIRQGLDPQAYGQELELNKQQIYGLKGLTPVQQDKLWQDYQQGAGIAFLNHVIDTNPKAAIGLVDSGAFNEVLTPEQIEAVRNGAHVEVRRLDAAAEHAANVAKAQITDQTQVVTEKAAQGIDVSAELPGLIQQWTALGDQSKVEQLKGLARESAFAKVWDGRTPLEREARVRELAGVPAGKRSEDQQAELKWLQDKRGALDGQFASDRVGFVMEHGASGEQPPALDPNDPSTFAARSQWQRTAARTYGQMDLLSRGERQALADRLRQGDAGYGEVTDQLALFGGQAARQAAREVAPDDHYLQQLVLLPQSFRKIARDGRDALRENSKLVPAETSTDVDPDVVRYSTGFERALMAVPQADRNAIKDVARNIAAKFLHDYGGELTPRLWGRALNMALGASGADGKGGLGKWNDMAFLVPDNLTAQQFADRVFGYVRAHPGNGPVNPDGTPANLRVARPVALGGGRYQFMVGDRPVLARGRDGKITSPWIFMVGGAQ